MVRSITDTLRHLEAGCLIDDASEKLADLVKAVDATGKTGTLTLTLKLRKATAGALAVTDNIERIHEATGFMLLYGNAGL